MFVYLKALCNFITRAIIQPLMDLNYRQIAVLPQICWHYYLFSTMYDIATTPTQPPRTLTTTATTTTTTNTATTIIATTTVTTTTL